MRPSLRLVAVTCALATTACTSAMELEARGTERVPAAKASIDVEVEGSHRDVDVQVHDLPAPESLGGGFARYGVWMIASDGTPTFLGMLRYQSDISYGELETQAPLEPVEILVTAEHDEPGTSPSDVVVLRRTIP